MFDRISYTWDLMKASWQVLMRDKAMIIFPLCSGICCLLVMASFIVPLGVTGAWHNMPNSDMPMGTRIAYYAMVFLFYFCNYFVITFFNVAITACAISIMTGGSPSIGGGFREAASRIHLILAWALVSATVGLILKIIAERSGKLGRIVTSLMGAAWSIVTFLVVPILVVENKGPIAAVTESAALLKRTWGNQLLGNAGFGFIFFLFMIPGIALIVFGFMSHSIQIALVMFFIAVVYFIVLSLVNSALHSIFQAAVYLYTQDALLPNAPVGQGFPVQLVSGAMSAR